MASVKIVFRKDKLNKKNMAPIHFRMIKHRRIRYISSKIMLEQKYWSELKNAVKPSHPNSTRINSKLTNQLAELQDEIYGYETKEKSLNTAALKAKIMGKDPVDFMTYAKEVVADYLKAGQIGTHDKNNSILNKLEKYLNGRRLDFQDLTIQFLVKYEKYLRYKIKNHPNTINNSMKFFRKVYNQAVRQDVIEPRKNSFDNYEMKTHKTGKAYLTEKELEKFDNVDTPGKSRISVHQDMFVFACYAAGLRVSDVLRLEWSCFDGVYLHVHIKKTDSQLSIKCPTRVLEIIDFYKKENRSDRFIFPVLDDDLDFKDLAYTDRRISTATALINKNLKIIATSAKIKKNISFHVSRHTWATRALTKGMSIEKVSRLLGHSNIKETQVYAKIVGKSLDEGMDLFE